MSMIDSPAFQPHVDGLDDSSFRLPRRVFVGQIVTPKSLTSIRLIRRGVLGVGSSGLIRFVEDLDEVEGRETNAGGPSKPTPRHAESTSSPFAVPDPPTDEDRSATPVNVSKAAPMPNELELTLPPPAMAPEVESASNGLFGQEESAEQKLIERVVRSHGWQLQYCETVVLSPNSFLCPGFIDTHVHAPQVPNLGLGQQYELLDWLENVTFPREKKFEDPLYARKTYEAVVQRMLDSGTTCAAMYATLHEEATMILAHICNEKGMRAFVGKCQQDRQTPVDYKEKSSAASMESTKRFISYCRSLAPYGTPKAQVDQSDPLLSSGSVEMDQSIARLSATMKSIIDDQQEDVHAARNDASVTTQSPASRLENEVSLQRTSSLTSRRSAASGSAPAHSGRHSSTSGSGSGTPSKAQQRGTNVANALVQPILTPRFAISCSDALLASISALMSRDGTLRVQTHLSENAGEIAFTKELFPFCQTYTDVYDHFSLLTPRTILAHAIHLSDEEMNLIARRKSGISHCPTSNLNLRSGASKLGELLNRGVKVGLGTDMSGGFGMSVLTAIRDASIVAKVVQFSGDGGSAPTSSATNSGERRRTTSHDFCAGPLPIATLFYLATLGGAEVCNVEERVGSLEAGKDFDALLFNCDNSNPNLYIEDDDDLEAKLEKALFCADDRNIASVFVRGRVVGGSAPIG